MRIEELDMTLRTWPGATKYIGHARAGGDAPRSITVCAEGSDAVSPKSWKVTLLQGPVSVEGDWHPTIQESYEQAVLEALEGAPKLAKTVSDIAYAVRVKRRAAQREAEAQAERDAGITPIADMHEMDEGSHW